VSGVAGTGRGRGIALMVTAVALFAAMDAVVKHVVAETDPLQTTFLRYLVQFVLMLALVREPSLGDLLRSERKGLLALRGFLLLASTLMFFTALRHIPLADATAIGFVSPLFVTALSVVALQEKVGPRRWTAVAVGLAGGLLIIRPGFGDFHWAMVLPLGMALLFAGFQILTRILNRTEPPLRTLFWTGLVGTFGALPLQPLVWAWPRPEVWLLMILVGAVGTFGHYLLIQAYRHAPASVLSPFVFSQLVTAALLGWLAFDHVPDGPTVLGALIIVASGLYVFHRETVVARPAAPS